MRFMSERTRSLPSVCPSRFKSSRNIDRQQAGTLNAVYPFVASIADLLVVQVLADNKQFREKRQRVLFAESVGVCGRG